LLEGKEESFSAERLAEEEQVVRRILSMVSLPSTVEMERTLVEPAEACEA
jgi:hypothetical protein